MTFGKFQIVAISVAMFTTFLPFARAQSIQDVFAAALIGAAMEEAGISQQSSTPTAQGTQITIVNGSVGTRSGENDESAASPSNKPKVVQQEIDTEAKRQDTEWTPENIRAYPVEFLSFSLKQINEISDKMQTRIFDLRAKQKTYERARAAAELQRNKNLKFLQKVKAAYKEAGVDAKEITINGEKVSREVMDEMVARSKETYEEGKLEFERNDRIIKRIQRKINEFEQASKDIDKRRKELELKKYEVQAGRDIGDVNDLSEKAAIISDYVGAIDGVVSGKWNPDDFMEEDKTETSNLLDDIPDAE